MPDWIVTILLLVLIVAIVAIPLWGVWTFAIVPTVERGLRTLFHDTDR